MDRFLTPDLWLKVKSWCLPAWNEAFIYLDHLPTRCTYAFTETDGKTNMFPMIRTTTGT